MCKKALFCPDSATAGRVWYIWGCNSETQVDASNDTVKAKVVTADFVAAKHFVLENN